MNTLHLNFNSNLNLNLNSLLVLLPFLPRHTQKPYAALLSFDCVGKKNWRFFNLAQTSKTAFGPWLNGGPVSSYATTTRRQALAISPPGPSHSLIAPLSLTSLTGMPVAQVNPIGSV